MPERQQIGIGIAVISIVVAVMIAFQPVSVEVLDFYGNGTFVSQRTGINLVDGSRITVTAADEVGESRVNYTIAADSAYNAIQDEGIPLIANTTLDFVGAGVTCSTIASETSCNIPIGVGGGDLQATYDLESAPALIILTDVLGGIILEGDAETSESTLTVRDSTAGKVGILVDNDDEVAAEASPLLRLANSTIAGGDDQFDLRISSTGEFEILDDGGSPRFSIRGDGSVVLNEGGGNVGIGDLAPTEATLVVGNAGGGNIYATFATSGTDTLCWDGTGASLINDCSSLRVHKENVTPLSLGLATALQLQPREFNWIETMGGKRDLGFVAEEVEAINPLLVDYREDGQLSGVRYRQLTSLLTNAIQELNQRIEDLEATILELQGRP